MKLIFTSFSRGKIIPRSDIFSVRKEEFCFTVEGGGGRHDISKFYILLYW
jgi:hypothetical protein